MQRKQVMRIVFWSTAVLIIPLMGQLFVHGWNWMWNDFLFAWVFFNLLGFTYVFVTHNVSHRGGKIATGILVIAIFAFVWIRLATG